MSMNRSRLVPWMVYLGAVILVGIPAMVVLTSAFALALEAVGLESIADTPAGGLAVLTLAVLCGLQLAVEIAALRLGGIEALGRGSPRVALARYLLFAGSAFLVLLTVTWIGLSAAFSGYGRAVLALGLLVALAGVAVIYRSSRAFLEGVRRDGHGS